jgi:hypothetical protein
MKRNAADVEGVEALEGGQSEYSTKSVWRRAERGNLISLLWWNRGSWGRT